jgi:hypothetical protein
MRLFTVLCAQTASLIKRLPSAEATHGEKYTRLTCLFARLLRCVNRYIARYAPVFTP